MTEMKTAETMLPTVSVDVLLNTFASLTHQMHNYSVHSDEVATLRAQRKMIRDEFVRRIEDSKDMVCEKCSQVEKIVEDFRNG